MASNDADLVCQALRAAATTRGSLRREIIHHSDRGTNYAGNKYRLLLTKLGMLSSMSAKGNRYDNAAMESFYGRFKVSSVGNEVFADADELKAVIFEYIEPFYDRFRKHSSLGYKSPIQFEKNILPPMGGHLIVKPNGLPKQQLTHTLTKQENPLSVKTSALHELNW